MAVPPKITMYTTPNLLQHLARSNQTTHGALSKGSNPQEAKSNT